MRLEHHARIEASREQVWAVIMDVPRVAKCVPGVEAVEPLGEDRYRGTLRVAVGPIKFSFQGEIAVTEQDEAAGRASMRAEANDRKAGGAVKATMQMALAEAAAGATTTDLHITTDAQIMGRIGDFGQPIIKRKADQIVQEFARNLQREVAGGSA